jgi:hypothetical protein
VAVQTPAAKRYTLARINPIYFLVMAPLFAGIMLLVGFSTQSVVETMVGAGVVLALSLLVRSKAELTGDRLVLRQYGFSLTTLYSDIASVEVLKPNLLIPANIVVRKKPKSSLVAMLYTNRTWRLALDPAEVDDFIVQLSARLPRH